MPQSNEDVLEINHKPISDPVTQDKLETRMNFRITAILIIIALFVPHSFVFTKMDYLDISSTSFALWAALWLGSYSVGSTIAGPFSYTTFYFNPILLSFNFLFLPFYVVINSLRQRFMKGRISKRVVLGVIGFILIIQQILHFTFQFGFSQWYPLPFFHIFSILLIVKQPELESN